MIDMRAITLALGRILLNVTYRSTDLQSAELLHEDFLRIFGEQTSVATER